MATCKTTVNCVKIANRHSALLVRRPPGPYVLAAVCCALKCCLLSLYLVVAIQTSPAPRIGSTFFRDMYAPLTQAFCSGAKS